MAHRIQLTVSFLASDYVPRMSLFSGRTDGVLRGGYTVFPRLPWPWQRDVQFHMPVRMQRVPQGHLEVPARHMMAFLRLCFLPALLIFGVWWLVTAFHWAEARHRNPHVVGAVFSGLASWAAAGGLLFWGPRLSVRIHMLDYSEHLEVLFPDHFKSVADAYQAAYDRWVADKCPRFFGDPDDHSWPDVDSPDQADWDQAPPNA